MIPNTYKAVIGITLAAALAVGAYVKGREAGLERYYAFKAEVEVANEIIARENQQRVEEAQANTVRVAEIYADHAADIERSYVSRLRHARSSCAAVSADPGPTERPDGAAEEPGVGAPTFEAICHEIERDAAADALKLIWLQEWVGRVCVAGERNG